MGCRIGTPAQHFPVARVREGLLLGAAALLFFARLDCPLLEPEETRYAEIPREMLADGRWLVPELHGQPYYDKPPLLYWLVMASYGTFGAHDWAARLIASGAAFLCIPLTYWWGKHTVGPRAAFAGALMLTLSARFIYLGRLLTMNGLLSLWVVAALASAHVALRRPTLSRRWWFLSAAACGLGLLTKGPVAILLVTVPLLTFQFHDPQTARPSLRQWAAYVAAACAVAAPWFLAIAISDAGFVRYFFWTHHVVRFATPLDHAEPAWFYLPGLLLGMVPWTLLLPGLAKHLTGRLRHRRRLGAAGCFLGAALWCLVFYSAAGCKRSGYILPAMPPLALALGWYFDRAVFARRRTRTTAWATVFAVAFVVLFAAIMVGLPTYADRFSLRRVVLAPSPQAQNAPVYCFPHQWDSVSFYLRRGDVRVFASDEQAAMVREFLAQPRSLLFVKTQKHLAELICALPPNLEFIPFGRQFSVTAGWVRRKLDH